MTQKMNKFNSLKKTTKVDFATYLGVIVVFIITTILQNNGSLKRSAIGLLVPICCYMSMAVSLNLTVGILGELSLGHAGFMSVGAFSGIVVSQSLMGAIPNAPVRLAISMVVGAIFAAIVGLLIGTPVLRLQGDYLAIVTLAFGEIIKELINCLIKPQFEAGREKVGKKGVVRDPDVHLEVLENFLIHAKDSGFTVLDITFSPIRGPEGNIEYLGYLESGDWVEKTFDLQGLVEQSHAALDHGKEGAGC